MKHAQCGNRAFWTSARHGPSAQSAVERPSLKEGTPQENLRDSLRFQTALTRSSAKDPRLVISRCQEEKNVITMTRVTKLHRLTVILASPMGATAKLRPETPAPANAVDAGGVGLLGCRRRRFRELRLPTSGCFRRGSVADGSSEHLLSIGFLGAKSIHESLL